jgi:hypothetical protein
MPPKEERMAAENARLSQARIWLDEQKLDGLIAFNDGQNSFLDGSAVYVFSGLRPLGRSAVVIARGGPSILIVEPASDGERASRIARTQEVIATDDLATTLSNVLTTTGLARAKLATVALTKQSVSLSRQVAEMLSQVAQPADKLASHLARIRSAEELADSR